jgi:release factor glutamine methyltransferase
LSYILGYADFLDLKLKVKPGGFIPRATTEFLASTAIDKLKRRKTRVAVDAATGVGPVALAIAHKVPGAQVWGTDISAEALRQARTNARALGLDNVKFVTGSLLDALPGALRGIVDVMTSHPPYVARHEVADLPAEVRDFEPVESLTDDEDGFALIRQLVSDAPEWLRPDGWLLLEVGTYIARPVRSILTGARYTDVRSLKGTMPYTRVLSARPPR